MTKPNATITIDLTPYKATINQRHAVIHDCRGSVLGKLDNDVSKTGYRFSEYFNKTTIDDVCVNVSFAENDLVIERAHFEKRHVTLNRVVGWISDNFDRIDSIGWEMLDKQW